MARSVTVVAARPALLPAAAVVLAALASAWLAARYLALSVDARYSLAWGAELMRGRVPDLGAPELTTPHPLPILVAAVLSPLGAPAASEVYGLLMMLSFALLLHAAFRLSRLLGGIAAAVIVVLLVGTRPRLAFFAAHGFVDVPFTALVLLAGAVAAEGPRRNAARALGLLAVAGVLRPEAWALSLIYGAFMILLPGSAHRDRPRARPLALAALAVAAPLGWLGFDLALTGDAAHSLNGTRSGAVALERATGAEQLWPSFQLGIERLVGWAVAAAGAVVAVWGVAMARGRRGGFALAAALVAVGLGAFGVLAYTELPLNDRYLLVPALGLACLAAAGAGGLERRSPVPVAALLLALGGTLSGVPADLRETTTMLAMSREKRQADADLELLLGRPEVMAAIDRCARVTASGSGRAAAAALLARDPAQIPIARSPVPPPGAAAISTAGSVRRATPGVTRQGAWALVDRCS